VGNLLRTSTKYGKIRKNMTNTSEIRSFINAYQQTRERDIRPLFLFAGLNKRCDLTEVHNLHYDQLIKSANSQHDGDAIHAALEISKINKHVDHYLGSGSKSINNALWEHHIHGTDIPMHIISHVRGIESVLHTNIQANGVRLYSGLRQSPVTSAGIEWNSTRPKKLIHLPAFTSTSTDFDTATLFTDEDHDTIHHESDHHGIIESGARHIIQLNFGNKISSIASLKKHSSSSENEVILGRGHEFFLNPRPTKIEDDGFHSPVYLWNTEPGVRVKPSKIG
jgi:hypothetical protein